jgi:outer membrane protein OmpA-like peptidoglycan-associated protein
MKRSVLTLLLTCLPLFVAARPPADRIYQAPMESAEWVVSNTGVLQCRLTHEIPLFGKAVFYRDSGRPLRLRIDSWQPYPKAVEVVFSSISAAWKQRRSEAELARLRTLGGGSPMLRVDAGNSRRAWYELQQGFQPTFSFVDVADGNNLVAIVLSTVRFRDSEQAFNDCVARLYPDNFEDVKRALVFFDFDEEFPPEGEEERALARLLAYIRVDPSVKTVRVVGHADEKGSSCYNDNLSKRRAQYIYDWLILSGLDPKMLRMDYRGEREPRIRGRSEQARAANRRVEVLLER